MERRDPQTFEIPSAISSGDPDASCKRKATLPHCAVGNKIAFWWPFFIRGSVSRERTVEDTAAEGGGEWEAIINGTGRYNRRDR